MKLIQQIPPGVILELLGNALNAQVAFLGADLRYRYANDEYHAWNARLATALRGKAMADVLGKDEFEKIRPNVETALAGEAVEFDLTRRHPTAGLRTLEVRFIPDRQPDGTVPGFLEILHDVTDSREQTRAADVKKLQKQRIEAAVALSERRFRTMVDKSPLSVQIFASDGRCLRTNEAWSKLWNGKEEEAKHYNILLDRQLEELGLSKPIHESFDGEAVNIEPYYYDPAKSGMSGRPRWVEAFLYPIRMDEDTEETILVQRDVTEQRLAQDELSATKERLQLIVNTALGAVITIDANDIVTGWEGKAANVFGWTREDAVGLKLFDLIFPPQARPPRTKETPALLAGNQAGTGHFELTAVRKDGTRFPVELAISRAKLEGQTFYSIFAQDISIRKDAEEALNQLNADLEKRVRERTEELSTANRELAAFSYSVAHDLRNPLRRLAAVSSILEEEAGPVLDETSLENLKEIRRFVSEMAKMIEDHLHFAKFAQAAISLEQVDFSSLAWSVVRNLRETFPATEFRVRILPSLRVQADPQLLSVALENMIENAAKFSQNVESPTVEIGTATPPRGRVFFVRDNGVGFDSAFAAKLFVPFQRLHREGEYPGTGVGLANVKRIIERHGGEVWAEGAEGRGATFYFTLSRQA